jgi:uncharacterized protein (DUF2336 family)
MTDAAALAAPGAEPEGHRARHALLKRLADVVSLPASRINAFERSVVGDLLVEMLRLAEPRERQRVAARLAPLSELPNALARLLLRDTPDIAGLLIERCASLTDADLCAAAQETGPEHRLLMAQRRGLSEVLTETLMSPGEPEVLAALLRNATARLSQPGIEMMVGMSRDHPALCDLLLRRPELRPSGAYAMFWWCGPDERRLILQRFAVSRDVMQEVAEDVFAMAAAENWADPVARKALQFIERRQRNRAAIEKSPFADLEAAVAHAAREGLSRETASEIAYLSGVKPLTGAKILADLGGEPVAILCKATGLDRNQLAALWRALRRPETDDAGGVHPTWDRVQQTWEMLAVDRAQTVLRYWNWALSSALSPRLLQAIRDGDEDAADPYAAPERLAILTLSQDFRR